MRMLLYPSGTWPGEVFGEKMPFIVRYHRKYLPVQSTVLFFGQIYYLIAYWNTIDFLVRGHCFLNICLCFVTIVRCALPCFHMFGKIIKTFIMTFHLGHFKHKGKHYQEMHTKIDNVSYYCTLYMAVLLVVTAVLFNAAPFYSNYTNGAFSAQSFDNTTLEFSVYYAYPGFDPVDKFVFASVFNIYVSYTCGISICAVDLVLYVMVFQIIGHIQLLRQDFTIFPKPSKSAAGQGKAMDGEMYDADENQMVHGKLVECIRHHRLIVDFTHELSVFFGPLLGVNYAFHLVGLCLLLLLSTQGTTTLYRFGTLTLAIFGQLIQISVTFEIVGTLSEKLKDSVYETPWELMNTRNRRIVIILLKRVQTPIHVTAMGMTTVGVTTMASILKTTITYFAFLQSMEK